MAFSSFSFIKTPIVLIYMSTYILSSDILIVIVGLLLLLLLLLLVVVVVVVVVEVVCNYFYLQCAVSVIGLVTVGSARK
jgi:hypothetical protein